MQTHLVFLGIPFWNQLNNREGDIAFHSETKMDWKTQGTGNGLLEGLHEKEWSQSHGKEGSEHILQVGQLVYISRLRAVV